MVGSANLTGAGMGAKSDRKRNFENGVVTDDASLIAPLEDQFDAVWRGVSARTAVARTSAAIRSMMLDVCMMMHSNML